MFQKSVLPQQGLRRLEGLCADLAFQGAKLDGPLVVAWICWEKYELSSKYSREEGRSRADLEFLLKE